MVGIKLEVVHHNLLGKPGESFTGGVVLGVYYLFLLLFLLLRHLDFSIVIIIVIAERDVVVCRVWDIVHLVFEALH